MSIERICQVCNEEVDELDDDVSCDFCRKQMCHDCMLTWEDEQIGDGGYLCQMCVEKEEAE